MTSKAIEFADVSVLAALEAAVRARLVQVLGPHRLDIEEFPADPVELEKPPLKSRVLVAFVGQTHEIIAEGDSWNRSRGVKRIVSFDINYDFASLRSHAAVYFVLDLVNQAMQGWMPSIATIPNVSIRMEPCAVVSDTFKTLVDGATYLYVTRIQIPFVSLVEQQINDPVQLKSLGIAIHRSQIGDLSDAIQDIVLTLTPPPEP